MRDSIFGYGIRHLVFLLCFAASWEVYADERGAVTAIASLNAQTSAFIGFSSGDILYCTRLSGCSALEGTPKSAVTAIDSPREEGSVMVWVGYENGHIYFCTLTGGCSIQEQILSGRLPGERSSVDGRPIK